MTSDRSSRIRMTSSTIAIAAICCCYVVACALVVLASPLSSTHWSLHHRALPSDLTSFSVYLHHGDADRIASEFATIFDPKHSRYLDYPSDAQLHDWSTPTSTALSSVRSWLSTSVCNSARTSCTMIESHHSDRITIHMNVNDMESFVGVELHVYQHRRNIDTRCIRSITPLIGGIRSLIPSHLHLFISHTDGIDRFPIIYTSHTARLGDSQPRGHAENNELKEDATTTTRAKSDHSSARLKSASDILPNHNIDGMIDTIPGSNPELLGIAVVGTSDQRVLVNSLVWCTLEPLVIATLSVTDGSIYCPSTTGSKDVDLHISTTVIMTDLNGVSTSHLMTPDQSRDQAGSPAIYQQIPVVGNYAGYKVTIVIQYQNTTATGVYPYLLSPSRLMTPSLVRSWYSIPASLSAIFASTKVGIGAFFTSASNSGYYSPHDLDEFWVGNNLTLPQPRTWLQDYTKPNATHNNPAIPDGETELDIEYSLGTLGGGAGSGVIYHVVSDTPYEDIMDGVLQDPSPPSVLSFSYGGSEADEVTGAETIAHTNVRFQMIALRKVSVIVSSGDSGAYFNDYSLWFDILCSQFRPMYPASSPFVTTVGGTALVAAVPGACPVEVLASLSVGGQITSGGGFSNVQSMPPYQVAAVQGWLADPSCPKPKNAYNASNRAYPDIVLFAHDFSVVEGGRSSIVDGTSASAPSFAGMVALFNDLRLQKGLEHVGFLNPLLYQAALDEPRSFTDVISGGNACLRSPSGCCADGYRACKGFDAGASGLGSVNWRYLQKAFGVDSGISDAASNGVAECDQAAKGDNLIHGPTSMLILIGCIASASILMVASACAIYYFLRTSAAASASTLASSSTSADSRARRGNSIQHDISRDYAIL